MRVGARARRRSASVQRVVAHALQPAEPFVPIGVWYGGGTSRAPMVSRNPAPEKEAWRRDLAAIKFARIQQHQDVGGLGECRTRARPLPFRRARAVAHVDRRNRSARHRSNLYGCGARMARQALPGFEFRHRSRGADRIAGISRLLPRSLGCPRGHGGVHRRRVHGGRTSSPRFTPSTSGASRTSSTGSGSIRRPNSATARTRRRAFVTGSNVSIRPLDAVNGAWYRTFSSWDEVEAPTVRHHPFLYRPDRLEDVHRGEARGRSQAESRRVRSSRRATGFEPFRCAGDHAQSALRIRQSGRLVDDAVG